MKCGSGVRDLTRDTIYTHPSSIQCNASNEISSLKSSVSNGKNLIANAITGKGVATSSSDTFATMASNIGGIEIESAYAKALRAAVSLSVAVSSSFTGEIINASDFDLYIKDVKYNRLSGPYNVVSQTSTNGRVSNAAVISIAMTKRGSSGTVMWISFRVDNIGLVTASIGSSGAPISYNIIDMTMNGDYLYITADATPSSAIYEDDDDDYQCGWGPTLETGTRRIRLELYNWFWYIYTDTASHEFNDISLIRTK